MTVLRIFAIGTFILAIGQAYQIASLATGPIPMQFDMHGNVNWSLSPHLYSFWHLIFLGFCNILTVGLSLFVDQKSMKWLNIPMKDYWLSTEERKNICRSKIKNLLAATAAFINLISFLSQAMTASHANLSGSWLLYPLSLTEFLVFTFSGTVLFIFWVFHSFRPRADDRET